MTPYPAYKPTGLPWLPQIPEHWDWRMLSQLASERYVKNTGCREKNVLSLSYGNIIKKKNIYGGLSPQDYAAYQIVYPQDVILRLTDLQNDHRSLRTGLARECGIITSAYTCLKIHTNAYFVHYLLHAYDLRKVFYGMGGGVRQSIGFKDIRGLRFPVPPPDEQAQIVRYLDSMTAKINKLIRAKKKQIALLQEQKQAIINQAVTKGLNPNAEMKDSGIDWLGKIPKHWIVKEIQRVCRLQGGAGFPAEYQGIYDETIPFIKVNALSSHISSVQQYDTVSAQTANLLGAKIFSKGDIVFAKVGAALLLQRFEILPFDCCIDNNMMAMFKITEDVQWLKHSLSLLNFERLVNPGAVPSISQSQVGTQKIPCPPSSEQTKISCYINKSICLLDKNVSCIENSVSLIQEHKNSLISSVVTGQVDVRNISVDDFDPADLVSEVPDDPEEENAVEESEE